MSPVIGITCAWDEPAGRYFLSRYYTAAVEEAGGRPVLLPHPPPKRSGMVLPAFLDGLILSGGGDVDPSYFGEEPLPGLGEIAPERDAFEMELTRRALAAGLPLLGICRGAQVLNIAAGGDIYQDIKSQVPGCLQHGQQGPRWFPSHNITIEGGTRLARILGSGIRRVNSFHHQAVRRVAPGFKVAARATDGIIEAIEYSGPAFVLGVQWHPETMWERDGTALDLFKALVEAAVNFSGGA
ncbi:gamma-glutamyl-gamma-aminobutyrate hydrolase family protein [Desulfofundulus thermobenzoicus]|uniref:Gamma-glutamyl-gamma-aminobutyrate hydrolase family protein n=1 Tax=Desulfofundulus thermobenzoicus TaxID=29376 RepID=A0A6N7ISS2_9FIRM|nr:gamma-glutamyl-gamma-aminobutyrate hydrolase family protein [Desulfofundulus thermobenzoicus]MQL52603.1 gamma-glutamyl-gamma-aminobutyrate hydrolase family protein [Desulfofundulus thermobenzoicus]